MTLLVCWAPPGRRPASGSPVLSFLPPVEEERLFGTVGPSLLRARAASASVRRRARGTYLSLVAAIGAARDAQGRLFREVLGGAGGPSRWWLHPVSYKDCEEDGLLERVIAIETIRDAAATLGTRELELWGAPPGVAEALSWTFGVRSFCGCASPTGAWCLLRGIAARIIFGLKTSARALRERSALVPEGADIAVLGFWDWSVWPDGGGLRDRYLGSAPAELRGTHKIAWLVWPDPEGNPSGRVPASLPGDRSVVPLTRWLGIGDVVRVCLDLAPLRQWRRWSSGSEMRAALRREGVDYFPVFAERLLRGFADASIPRASLIGLAFRRATALLRPRAVVSFLECHPVARAVFHGARAAAPSVVAVAVQHASLAPEKTFYFYDASERSGPMPAPVADLACAAGEMGAEVFRGQGCRIVETTGTPRYDWLRPAEPRSPRASGPWRLLIACGLDSAAEAEMVEAVVSAAQGLSVEIAVRDHPFARTSEEPGAARLSGRFRVSQRPLADDLAWADLVLFTYSTVGEEAVMLGVPAWQWRRLGPDMSALAAEADIPRFDSVPALRAALNGFSPGKGLPPADRRGALEKRLFHRLDGGSGRRVADAIRKALP